MKISVHSASVEQCSRTLKQLLVILDKGVAYAQAKKFEPSVLVNSRLAPDMLPLNKQVQIACDMIKNGAARLSANEAPKFEDNEQTVDELKARIQKTLDYIKSIPASAFEGAEDRDVTIPTRTEPMTMKGMQYLSGFVLPNFYFHSTMVYALLRHNGVDVGKMDFIGALK